MKISSMTLNSDKRRISVSFSFTPDDKPEEFIRELRAFTLNQDKFRKFMNKLVEDGEIEA